MEWRPCDAAIELRSQITTKALTRFIAPYKDLAALRVRVDRQPGRTAAGRRTMVRARSRTTWPKRRAISSWTRSQLGRMVDAIALRKNLILQGPPGVGKTFIARRIAWCLMGCKDSSAIEMVQFHQSYAYEDFVQGWRPTETGGFTLRSGVFLEFCKRAEAHGDKPYVFIIDEINRGNLSRIFGELLMLLEADKRGRDFAIPLTYSPTGERFAIPPNVHVLGLMNTADRSLAIVDYALRRRFAFESLKPAFGTRQFREHLLEADMETGLVDRIVRNMSELNERIRGDKDLGPGFEIGHSYFVPEESADEEWYVNTVETQIAPLLARVLVRQAGARRRAGGEATPLSAERIPISNVYYLLCYAWRHVEERDLVGVDALEELDRVHDLLATVLVQGTFRLVRQGIDRGYRDVREDLAGIRGEGGCRSDGEAGVAQPGAGRVCLRGADSGRAAQPDPAVDPVRTAACSGSGPRCSTGCPKARTRSSPA